MKLKFNLKAWLPILFLTMFCLSSCNKEEVVLTEKSIATQKDGHRASPPCGFRNYSSTEIAEIGQIEMHTNLTDAQEDFLLCEVEIRRDIILFIEQVENEDYGISSSQFRSYVSTAIKMLVDLQMEGLLYTSNSSTYENVINQHNLVQSNPFFDQLLTIEIINVRLDHPNWSDTQVYLQASFNVFLERLHLSLDLAGLVPAVGEIADITNGIIYTIEGDGINAALSYSAAIPVAGWFSSGVRLARRGIITTNGTRASLKFIVNSEGIIEFGRRGQLRTIIKPPSNHQAHHVIPWEHRNHPVVQEAAKVNFHMNDHLNGIPMHTSRHSGSHPNYSTQVENRLEQILNSEETITPTRAVNELTDLINRTREVIENSTTHINQISVP